jgi:SAM-dependent methyltransferase
MEFDAHGIDVSDFYMQHWRNRSLPAEVATVEALAARNEPPFDAIISRQVIEHVLNPQEFFQSCARLLKPGGVYIVETGDAGSIQAKLLRRNWKYWTATEKEGAHVSFLTIPSARSLGERNGMELAETVSMFEYVSRTAYARQFHEPSPGLKTTIKHLLVRYVLRGNVSYRFRRLPNPAAGV